MRRAFSVAVYARLRDRVLVILHRRLATWLPIGGELEPGETPLEAARRELREETGLEGRFAPLAGAVDGEPPGYLGYEEHQAGSKGLHMNFVFVADVTDGIDGTDGTDGADGGGSAEVMPNHEFSEFRWVDAEALGALDSPTNVRELGFRALAAVTKK